MRPVLAGALALLVTFGLTVALLPRDAPVALDEREEGPAPPAFADAEEAREEGLARPTWRVGQAWHVQFLPSKSRCALVVVAQERDGGALQGAACADAASLAAEDAVHQYPFMGRFGPGLEGVREEETVEWYAWPLTDGKEWRTRIDGRDVKVEARFDPRVEGPHGREPGFRLAMREAGDVLATYDYVPSIGWWGRLTFQGGFEMRVEGFTADWRGEAVHAEPTLRLRMAPAGANVAAGTFVSTPEDDVLVVRHAWRGQALQQLRVLDPDGEERHRRAVLPFLGGDMDAMTRLEPEEGTWRVEAPFVGTAAFVVEVYALDLRTSVL